MTVNQIEIFTQTKVVMKNPFIGKSRPAKFAKKLYKRMLSKEWFSYADVLADSKNLGSAKELEYSVSADEKEYRDLKKAFYNVREAIKERFSEELIAERGDNRCKEFCYVGDNRKPLEDMWFEKYKNDLKDYFDFCQDSAGFMPTSWVEHYLKDTLDLYEIKRKKKEKRQIIGSSVDRKLNNIELLPDIYEYIRGKNVIEVTYREGYKKTTTTVIFHPHYLKEFNGGWHIFGHAEGKEPNDAFDISLDRIEGKPKMIPDAEYIEPQEVKYPDYFDDIVGTSHGKDKTLYSITIRIHTEYMFGLMENKPIHHSQKTVLPYDKERGYGEVQMELRPNNEFYGRVLQFGSELEIISPDDVRKEMVQRIKDMHKKYCNE